MTDKDNPSVFPHPIRLDGVMEIHAEARKGVLMTVDTQQGSASHMMNGYTDVGCPSFLRRPATNSEKVEVERQQEPMGTMENMLRNR